MWNIAQVYNSFLNCRSYLSFSSKFSLQLNACFSFCSTDSKLTWKQGGVGRFASGRKIFLQELPPALTGMEILMAAYHLSVKSRVSQSFSIKYVILILTLLNQSLACNFDSVYLNRCSLCCFLVVRESSDCRNGMSHYQTKRRKRSQENLFKPF